MLQLYDKNRIDKYPLEGYSELYIERVLKTGDKTLSFSIPINNEIGKLIEEEGYIRTKTNEFVIKSINIRDATKSVTAKLNVEDLEGKSWDRFECVEQTISDCLNLALAGTGWTIGICTITKKRTIRKSYCSSWDIIQQARKTYRVEFDFDSLNKIINIQETLGSDKGAFLMDSLNLKKLEAQSNSYDFYTRLIAVGANNLTVTVTNNIYSNKIKTIYWKDERYTIEDSLREDAQAKLDEMSMPYRSYSATPYPIPDCDLGDTITIIDKEKNINGKWRIVTYREYPEEVGKDSIEIANGVLSFVDKQKEFENSTYTVNNITSDNGTVSESAIKTSVEKITINKADIQSLNAVSARVGTLEATSATITQLNAVNADIQTLYTDKAKVTDLTAAVARVNILETKTASIEILLAGNITAENIKAGTITAGSSIIANGAIGDAQISSLNAAKLNAGTVDTTKITIAGANSRLLITGNRLQVFATKSDNSLYERVSLGDVNGDGSIYGFRVRGSDGTTILLDEAGVKREGITDGSINNAKIAGDANISGTKLDIASVVTSINGGTTNIQSNKILINNSTLDVQFSNLNTTVINQGQSISTNTANISANTNAIALKLDTQTYNSYKSLNDNNITSINNTLSSHSSGISVLQGQIATKVSQVDIDTSIANLKIGGRNLLRGTELKDLTKWTNNGGTGSQTLEAGGGYLGSNCLTLNAGANNGRYQYYATELNVDYTFSCWIYVVTAGTSIIGFNQADKKIDITNATTGVWTYRTITFKGTGTNLPFYLLTNTAAFKVCLFKLEKGTKASDYTPAIEDTQGQIDSATTRITNAETSITQNTNAIALKLESSIFNSYKTTNDNNITTINSTLSANSSSISVLQGQITTKVTQTDINNSINSIAIGGRNLLKTSDVEKTVSNSGTVENYITYTIYNPLEPNTQYNLSFEYNATSNVKSVDLYFVNTGSGAQHRFTNKSNTAGVYVKISWTFTTGDNADQSGFIRFDNNGSLDGLAAVLKTRKVKLEKGNKATDWTPAPEDVQAQLDSHTTRISSAESKITNDAITNTVFTTTSSQSNSVDIISIHKDISYSNKLYVQGGTGEDEYSTACTGIGKNGYAQYVFTGTAIDVYCYKDGGSGICELFIDGVSKGTVDLYSTEYPTVYKIFSITGLANASHTVKLSQNGNKNISSGDYRILFVKFDITVPNQILTSSNMSSVFKQSANNVQVAFNDISPNVALSDSGEFDIINGSLKVKNNNAEVVIDGRYNMHKIISSGTINITIPANVGQYTYSLTHGLGYKPCIAAYYDNLDENFITPFPVMHLGNYAGIIGQGYLITFLGRVAITPTTLEFVFSKEGYYTAAEQHLLVRYYIYKEVAI